MNYALPRESVAFRTGRRNDHTVIAVTREWSKLPRGEEPRRSKLEGWTSALHALIGNSDL